MPSGFQGFSAEAMSFFRRLRRNNRREWFLPRKEFYLEQVRAPMIELVTALNESMRDYAPAHFVEPEKAIYRIYRDTRFSPDKTPYKTHIAAVFGRRGRPKHGSAGYYFSVSDQEVELAGGVYMPDRDHLLALRQHIAAHHAAFRRIAGSAHLRKLLGELQGEQSARVPKGFASTHPAADLLKYKQFLFYQVLDPAVATTPRLFAEIDRRFRALAPFNDFLNTALVAGGNKPARFLI